MINKFVSTLQNDLNLSTYINDVSHINGVKLGARNIANLSAGETNIEGDNLIVTIIRVEEESVLRNFPNQKLVKSGGTYQVDKRLPKIHLNYYLLFSATLQYDMAVATIDRVIKFFQHHRKIEFTADGDDLELNLELFSPSFEQLNNIWGMYGGKQLPNVIYKARVTALEKDEEQLKAVITSISSYQKHHE